MNASDSLPAITLCLACVALACEPKPSSGTAEPPAVTSEPTLAPPAATEPPAAEKPAAEKPATETPTSGKPDDKTPPSKCFTDGGTCVHKDATRECARFQQGEEWGCTDENTGCCFQ